MLDVFGFGIFCDCLTFKQRKNRIRRSFGPEQGGDLIEDRIGYDDCRCRKVCRCVRCGGRRVSAIYQAAHLRRTNRFGTRAVPGFLFAAGHCRHSILIARKNGYSRRHIRRDAEKQDHSCQPLNHHLHSILPISPVSSGFRY